MNWYLMAFQKYAQFKGRSRRKEFWMFILISFLINILFRLLDNYLLNNQFGIASYRIFSSLYSLIVFIPSLALSIRRLHDIEKSGWYVFLLWIPIIFMIYSAFLFNQTLIAISLILFAIGGIWLLALFCYEGDTSTNKYGPDPKNPTDELNEIGVSEA